MIRAGIFGATGYTGFELVKILAQHAHVDIAFVTSQSYAGQLLSDLYPTAPDLLLISGDDAPLTKTDVVFLCLPHAISVPTSASKT